MTNALVQRGEFILSSDALLPIIKRMIIGRLRIGEQRLLGSG